MKPSKSNKIAMEASMKPSAALRKEGDAGDSWSGFRPGDWQISINVRDFIVRNVTSYAGDENFLAGPSPRTKAVWAKLQPYFADERKKGVLAVDAKSPSTLLAHKAGYIDRDNEVVVGLQTDQPFKRAIFPYGGLRMPTGAAASSATIDAWLYTGLIACLKESVRNGRRSTTCGRPMRSTACARSFPSRCVHSRTSPRWRSSTTTTFRSLLPMPRKHSNGPILPI